MAQILYITTIEIINGVEHIRTRTVDDCKDMIKTDLAIEYPFVVPLSATDKDIKAGSNIGYLRLKFDIEVLDCGSELLVAPTGSGASFDITDDGVSILDPIITIDEDELSSQTAETPPVIDTSTISAGSVIGFDTETIGSTNAGKGGQTWIIYKKV